MKTISKTGYWALLAMLLVLACNPADDDFEFPERDNMLEFAANEGNYELLLEALDLTNLSSTVASISPITLFAPNDAAFQIYLDSAGVENLADLPEEELSNIMTNHIIRGEFRTNTLQSGYYSTISAIPFDPNIPSLAYLNLNNGLQINGSASVTSANNLVQNGIFHGIDRVATPATVLTFVFLEPDFDSLEIALTRNDLATDFAADLSQAGPYTIFAPNNAAFDSLLISNPDWNAIQDVPAETLDKVLRLHVNATANLRSNLLFNGRVIPTMADDETLVIDITSIEEPQIVASGNASTVAILDIQAENGVIHVIERVLLPEDL